MTVEYSRSGVGETQQVLPPDHHRDKERSDERRKEEKNI